MKTWQECCDHFGANPEHGLTQDQVKKYREKYGLNGKNECKQTPAMRQCFKITYVIYKLF